jgi:hypothetical protein
MREAAVPEPARAEMAVQSGMSDAASEPMTDWVAEPDTSWVGNSADDQPFDDPVQAEEPAEAAETEAVEPEAADIEVASPSIAPADDDRALPAAEPDHAIQVRPPIHEDIESFAARRQRRSAERFTFRLRWPLSALQSGILALVIADSILIGWRNDFVRALPQTASFYAMLGLPVNLRGLTFEGVTTLTEQHEGVPILVVEGNIVNGARRLVDIPRLKFAVRNAANEEVYSWTAVPPRPSLPPGEVVAFHTRLASPPAETREVLVRFVNRHDIISGTH